MWVCVLREPKKKAWKKVNNAVFVCEYQYIFSTDILILKPQMTHYKPNAHAFGIHFHPKSLILSLRVLSLGIELLTLALQLPFQLRALNC